MRWERFISAAASLSIGLAFGPVAHATYSIAAIDAATQEVGGAVTSCVGSLDVGVVYGSVPGRGVVHAQAQLDQRSRGKTRALELLGQGVPPSEIIAQITSSSLDSGFATRQYAVVDVLGRADGFTGDRAQPYKADRQSSIGTFTYSVQGNILTSQKVLDQAAAAFESRACDLAERLMLALEAGGANGEGDSRCTDGGIPTDSAFIQVDRPGEPAGSYLLLRVSNTAPASPLPRLRAMFDAWRQTHPCPSATPDAGTPMDDFDAGNASPPAAAGSTAMSAAGRSALPPAGGTGAAVGAAGAVAASGSGATGDAAATAGAAAMSGVAGAPSQPAPRTAARDVDRGCNLARAAGARPSWLLVLTMSVAVVTLRRGRRRVASVRADRTRQELT